MHIKILRPAIAMIELIFAIVIMGIVMMSAPMLISTATKSSYVALQQEGINEAASRVNMIMGYAWDDESDTNDSYIPPILYTTSTTTDLAMVGNTGRRIGIPMTSQRTYILSDTNTTNTTPLYASSTLGSDGITDDMDDFIGDITLTVEDNNDNDIDYVETKTININTTVAYSSDSLDPGVEILVALLSSISQKPLHPGLLSTPELVLELIASKLSPSEATH